MDFNQIVQLECKANRITSIEFINNKYLSGKSYHDRTIVMTEFETLCLESKQFAMGVFFHEIGHFYHRHFDKRTKFSYVEEYEATMYAIEKLKEYMIPYDEFEVKMKCYVIKKISQAFNKGHDLHRVPKKIREWIETDIDKWIGAKKVEIYEPSNSVKLTDLEITLRYKTGEKITFNA